MKLFCYIYFIWSTILFLFTLCSAEITINEYLSTAFYDESLVFQDEKIDFLKRSSSNTPFVNEIELRMNIDEFEDSKQEYTVRFNMNGWGEHSHGKKVYDISIKYNENERALLLNKSLKERYMDVIRYYYLEMEFVFINSLIGIFTDRLKVIKNNVGTLQFDAIGLIETEGKLLDLQLDKVNNKNAQTVIEEKIQSFFPNKSDFIIQTKNLIDIYSIQEKVAQLKTTFKEKNVHIQTRQYQYEMAQAKYLLEKAENNTYLSFFEAAYNMEQKDKFEKAFTMEFGVKIPIVNPNQLDINRRMLRSIKAKSEWIQSNKKIQMRFHALSRKINRLITQYDIISIQKERSRTEKSLVIFQQMEGVNPLILLKLKQSMLKNKMTMQKIKYQIYETYITLLDYSGKLVSNPLMNYLSEHSEPLNILNVSEKQKCDRYHY